MLCHEPDHGAHNWLAALPTLAPDTACRIRESVTAGWANPQDNPPIDSGEDLEPWLLLLPFLLLPLHLRHVQAQGTQSPQPRHCYWLLGTQGRHRHALGRVLYGILCLCMQGSLPSPQLKMWNKRHASGQPCQSLHGESPYPFRHGVDIFLGRTGAALCPVAAHSSSSRTAPH